MIASERKEYDCFVCTIYHRRTRPGAFQAAGQACPYQDHAKRLPRAANFGICLRSSLARNESAAIPVPADSGAGLEPTLLRICCCCSWKTSWFRNALVEEKLASKRPRGRIVGSKTPSLKNSWFQNAPVEKHMVSKRPRGRPKAPQPEGPHRHPDIPNC